ncbi:MAG: PorT family protein [Marinilabiliales bacterium]|nr:MAG: PorT family protein [Marinilabiliales bacterium]
MKRYIFLLIFGVVALCCRDAGAQVFNAGMGGGLNIAQVEGDGFSGYNKPGGFFGLFVSTPVSEFLSARMEINYSSKGSMFPTSIDNPRYYKIDLRYVEIPVLMRYSWSSGIIAEIGLSGGYLFFSREKDAGGYIPPEETLPFRKGELAAHAGAGWQFTEKISGHARVAFSVIRVREHAGGGTYRFNWGQFNNVLSFTVQYTFLSSAF